MLGIEKGHSGEFYAEWGTSRSRKPPAPWPVRAAATLGRVVEQTETYRVAWVDTDASGRIHYTAAFRWAEAAEAALFRRLGLLEDYGRYPRRHVEAEFERMLEFEDEIVVRLRVERIGTTSVSFSWVISSAGEAAVVGRHTVVFVDERGRSEPLRDSAREALGAAPL